MVAKPRSGIMQAESDEENSDQMQLSEDDEADEADLADIDVQVLTERKLESLLVQLRRRPDANKVWN